MPAATFWKPERLDSNRYRLLASEAACVGIPGRTAPMGGVTTAAAIEAMEHATGCSLVWAASQFLAASPVETDFDIEVEIVGGSTKRPQARATLRFEEKVFVVVGGALGPRETGGTTEEVAFVSAPDVPAMAACPALEAPANMARGGLFDQFERRLAGSCEEAGTQSLWFRSKAGWPVSSGLLAILGDFVAGAHPQTRGSIGLDNTIRIVALPAANELLGNIRIAHVGERIFHGGMEIYSDTGQLMALTGLSAVRPPRARRPRRT